MISSLLQAYRGKARISRGEFLVGFVGVYLAFVLVLYIHSKFRSIELGVWWVIERSALELLLVLMLIPLAMARLRDINWSSLFAFLLLPAWAFGTRNMVIYDLLWNEPGGVSGAPITIGGVLTGVVLLMFLVLFIKQPNSNKTLNEPEGDGKAFI